MRALADPPRHLFFTGKGGVGKTSLACAAAVALADQGRRVLLVSTDPASNLGQIFGVAVGNSPVNIPGVDGLVAVEIDPQQAAQAYRDAVIGPVVGILPETAIAAITEQLSGSCTTEIASFDRFTELLADAEATRNFDHVIFDTAPTGHTVRLLQLPGEWTSFLDDGRGDASCLGPMSGLQRHRDVYRRALEVLADPDATRLVLVARPDASSLGEAERTLRELASAGIDATHLAVNGVLPPSQPGALAEAVAARQAAAMGSISERLAELTRDDIVLQPYPIVGADALRSFLAGQTGEYPATDLPMLGERPLSNLVDDIARDGRGLILTVGKGGVGKTTIGAAIAVALADRGHDVLLTTTDPAAQLDATLRGSVPGLDVSAIDPKEATRAYRQHVLETKGKNLDPDARAALAEDLMSPCTEEVAVFRQFSAAVREAGRRFVVIDTAPTGHTVLLMDATGSYHRDIARNSREGSFTTPLMRLQDPDWTKAVIVTLPETTPVLEALDLDADLRRAGITPWAWVVNASLAAARPDSPLLAAKAASEQAIIDSIGTVERLAIVPMRVDEPVGVDALLALATASGHPAR